MKKIRIIALLLIQCIIVIVILFGDIGFDHPGKYGLDFGHFILLAIGFIISFIWVIVEVIKKEKKSD